MQRYGYFSKCERIVKSQGVSTLAFYFVQIAIMVIQVVPQ